MIKDVFVLRKSSYHVKIMYYIWKLSPEDFSHMCPYWWLSIFNHIVIVPFFCFKFTLKLCYKYLRNLFQLVGTLFEMLFDYIDRLEQERIEKELEYYKKNPDKLTKVTSSRLKKLKQKSDYDSYKLITNILNDLRVKTYKSEIEKKNLKLKSQFMAICDLPEKNELLENGNYIKFMEEKIKKDKLKAKLLEQERIINNKKRINKILKIIKPILTILAYVIGTIIILLALFYIIKGVSYIIDSIANISQKKWDKFIDVISTGFTFIILTILSLVIIYILIRFISKLNISITIPFNYRKFFNKLASPFVLLYKYFILIPIKFIINSIKFIIQMVKNECPAIKWID
jgi:hypothetical protein